MKIKALSIELANQIAAGEVIERPASVVKELLENAYDAGSTDIAISLRHGGLNLIKIADNGCGIDKEELTLAIAPHATSKIAVLDDLFSITSMGFRGEALASISAVSQFKITSRPEHVADATSLVVQNGVITLTPAARATGTTIEVGQLFYNTPVRKTFLKSIKTELLVAETVVKRFALAHPNISVSFSHNDECLWQLPAEKGELPSLSRIQKILGKGFVEAAKTVDITLHGIRLHGFIGDATYQRNQNDKMWVYVNKRMVKDKLLNHALKQAYESVLHPGRNPACLLYLTLDPKAIDVNVHPTKHEIRFKDARLVHDLMVSTIKKQLVQEQTSVSAPMARQTEVSVAQVNAWSNVPQSSHEWVVLNERFGLCFLSSPYIVDMRALMHYLLEDILTTTIKTRPLLVPLSFSHAALATIKADEKIAMLASIGIIALRAGAQSIVIRELPSSIPQLDIQGYLTAYFDEKITSSLIKGLLSFDKSSLLTLKNEDKQQLWHYLAGLDEAHLRVCPFVRSLDTTVCQDLFA